MYAAFLFLHSWMRWLVVAVAIVTVVRAWRGWMKNRPWDRRDEQLARAFPVLVDVQVLLGLILFVALSPDTSGLLTEGVTALNNERARFWTMEHAVPMVAALVLTHVGQVFIRRSFHDMAKHRWAAIVFGLTAVIILLSIPWPFSPNGRPLFRV